MAWDEPDLLQNVKRVSPWLVELVSNMPAIHLSPFSPPRKKLRLPQSDFPFDGQIALPSFSHQLVGSSNPFGCVPNSTTPAGMQGARHAQYGLSLSNLHFNKLHSNLFPLGYLPLDRVPTGPSTPLLPKPSSSENISCLLTIGNSTQGSNKLPSNSEKAAPFVLFGKSILPEKQISVSCSSDTVSSDGNVDKIGNNSDGSGQNEAIDGSSCEGVQSDVSETGHCKVFMESEDVGRTLDLSLLGSYDEMYRKLADMFGIKASEMLNRVLYRDATGRAKQVGDQPFR